MHGQVQGSRHWLWLCAKGALVKRCDLRRQQPHQPRDWACGRGLAEAPQQWALQWEQLLWDAMPGRQGKQAER